MVVRGPKLAGMMRIGAISTAQSEWMAHIRLNIKENYRPLVFADFTCGNGHDAFNMAQMLFNEKEFDPYDRKEHLLIGIDVQHQAIDSTRQRLNQIHTPLLNSGNIVLFQDDHSQIDLPKRLNRNQDLPIDVACFNLGWLPRSDKMVRTHSESSLRALERLLFTNPSIPPARYQPSSSNSPASTTSAPSSSSSSSATKGKTPTAYLAPGGLITMVLYPGHPEGRKEKKDILQWLSYLDQYPNFPTRRQWRVKHQEFLPEGIYTTETVFPSPVPSVEHPNTLYVPRNSNRPSVLLITDEAPQPQSQT